MFSAGMPVGAGVCIMARLDRHASFKLNCPQPRQTPEVTFPPRQLKALPSEAGYPRPFRADLRASGSGFGRFGRNVLNPGQEQQLLQPSCKNFGREEPRDSGVVVR